VDFISKKWDELEKLRDEYYAIIEENVIKTGLVEPQTPDELVEIISIFERIVELDPSKENWCILAEYLCDHEEWKNAIKCFEKVLEFDENNEDALKDKGIALCRLGEEEAIKCFDKVIRLVQTHDEERRFDNQTLSECWFYKGISLENLGKYKDALECYDQCIAMDEESHSWATDLQPALLINKSAVLSELGKYDDAIICYDRAVILDCSLKKSMVRPKPKMRLWKRMLSYVAFSGIIISAPAIIRTILS